MHPLLHSFVTNSSLRGVGKILKTTGLLRVLWSLYLITMLILMILAIYDVVQEYNKAMTSTMNQKTFNYHSSFPAVSICNYNPFSKRAEAIWERGDVVSPMQFQANIRNLTRLKFSKFEGLMASLLYNYDDLRLYYQNLPAEHSKLIGHRQDDILVHCQVLFHSHTESQRQGRMEDCKLRVTAVSHIRYFNCYSVQPAIDAESRLITRIVLVLNVQKGAGRSATGSSFLHSSYQQRKGLIVQIHEPDTLFQMEARGVFNIGPSTLVDIDYSIERIHTSKKEKCIEENSPSMTQIRDMDNNFTYSQWACIGNRMNELYIQKCECVFSLYTRPVTPTQHLPYCGHLDFKTNADKFFKRLQGCIAKRRNEWDNAQKTIEEKKCKRKCVKVEYKLHTSTSPWQADMWNMAKINTMEDAWRQLKNATTAEEKAVVRARIVAFLDKEDRELDQAKPDKPDNIKHHDQPKHNSSKHLCYLRLTRTNFDIMDKYKKFILNQNTVISRIGGTCSLTLGFTCVFFVEIIEYVYVILVSFFASRRKAASAEEDKHDTETNNNNEDEDHGNVAGDGVRTVESSSAGDQILPVKDGPPINQSTDATSSISVPVIVSL